MVVAFIIGTGRFTRATGGDNRARAPCAEAPARPSRSGSTRRPDRPGPDGNTERESLMTVLTERKKVRFISGDTECAAWHYPGTNGACVIMAGGGAVTKEPGTDLFAKRFHEAGYTVLAFDYRRLGESGGQPRQVIRIREQLTDWQAAIAFAAGLPGVDPTRLAIWGFSLSGGHVFRVAADNPQLAAAIAQTPNADGPAAARNAARHQKPLAMLRLAGRSTLDALGGLAGRPPLLIPLAGQPGTVAMLTTPDGIDGDRALNPGNRYPDWQQAVAAELSADHRCVAPTLPLGAHRHAMHADADLSLPGIARLVAELLDRLDLQDVTLVGNDTGGALVQLLMGDGAARVARDRKS